ncbi:FAD-dependent oxidoreductase [Streptomyces sp. NPDC054833]
MTTEHAQQPQENAGHSRRRFWPPPGRRSPWGAVGATVIGAAAGAAAAPSGKRVAVLGGGVSGLSAAHELAERGYAVTVYEYYDALGGKARSMDVPGTASGGRRPLPAERGFRFFPGFYRNLPDTMRRIPFPGNANGVHDNLRSGTEARFARASAARICTFPCAGSPPRPHPATSPRHGCATRSCPPSTSAPGCPPTRPPTSPTGCWSTSPAATPAARTSGRRRRGGTSSGPGR